MLAAFGLSHMAGRILAALLVAVPAEQSAEELAGTLQASRGSISTQTRLLETLGLIERVRKGGDRRTYYRNRPDAWHRTLAESSASLTRLRQMTERGAEIMAGESAADRRGIEDSLAFFRFWESELGHVLERWKEYEEGS